MKCDQCGHELTYYQKNCERCQKDNGAPNVRRARQSLTSLKARYQTAVDSNPGKRTAIKSFQNKIKQEARPVICVQFEFLATFLTQKHGLYNNYHRLCDAGARQLASMEQHQRRVEADNQLFPGYEKDINFCALSLDGKGATGWGDFHLSINVGDVESRISFTQHNIFRFKEWFNYDTNENCYVETPGYRAAWPEVSMLAAVKHIDDLNPSHPTGEFASILVQSAGNRGSDEFVEGHVHGPLISESISKILAPCDNAFKNSRIDKEKAPSKSGLKEFKTSRRKIEQLVKQQSKAGNKIDFECFD